MKTNSFKLSASLICADILHLEQEIELINKSGCEYIHCDIMDGIFVPRFGLFPEILTHIKKLTKLPLDVHLMTVNPEQYLSVFYEAGADIINVHVEACTHLHRTISQIKKLGIQAGVTLNPATSLTGLDYILDDVDIIQLMAINPGIVGHKLINSMINKISDLKQKIHSCGKDILIEIDGGVSPESAALMLQNGADILVCGSSTIFKPDIPIDVKTQEFISQLKAKGY